MEEHRFKIAVVGPTYPHRGGIAQYNTQLHRALLPAGSNTTVAFKKLYPKFLYPGQSDTEVGAEGKTERGIDYLVHVYKPWTLNETAKHIQRAGTKVAFLNWWTLFWQPGFAYLAWLLRGRGVKVVYICHNVFDHDAKGLKNKISKFFLKFADGYVVHSSGDEKTIKSFYDKPILNTKVLPVFDQYPEANKQIKKRGRLEILFFGFIRPYKGLEDLVEALAKLNDKDVYLTVVGEPWINPKELSEKVQKYKAPNIEMHLSFVNDDEAAFYFSRADLVAIPYRQNTASAVASLAFNYKKPLLGTSVEGIRDIVTNGETGWLVEPNSPDLIARKLSEITRENAAGMAPNIKRFCDEHSWEGMAGQILEFANELNETS